MSLRPAHGIELCDCPPKYRSESCQNPGKGFYRWYKQHFVTSVTIIDLVGESKKCECNGRADACHPETGLCVVSFKAKNSLNRIPLSDKKERKNYIKANTKYI